MLDDRIAAALRGDRRALARLITAVESGGDAARDILTRVFPRAGRAMVTGLTGAPGAGKSTLTDGLIRRMRAGGREVAVVAVDPSSPFTGGALLGDRVRMQDHVDDAGVYVRSLATRGHLGGMSEATSRVVTVLDAVGFPEIVIETVGVGQAEVEVVEAADTTVVVVNPGWGDGIQAAKAGLLEIGDVFVINKADRPGADEADRDLTQMLRLGGNRAWMPPVLRTVATTGDGVDELWAAIEAHREHLAGSGRLVERRRQRLEEELETALEEAVRLRVRMEVPAQRMAAMLRRIEARDIDPWSAAQALLDEG